MYRQHHTLSSHCRTYFYITICNEKRKSCAVLQEEFELAQRKFLRQLVKYSDALDTVYPRLVVVDFLDRTSVENDDDNADDADTRASTG